MSIALQYVGNDQDSRSSGPLDALLIYPQLGSFDSVLRDIPLSLIYAATHSVKRGYRVKILDLRIAPTRWREEIDACVSEGCRLVGLSVMTGNPIRTSLEISRYVKKRHGVPTVWGGPHPTILPEQTLADDAVDYVIRDWGSESLCKLIQHVRGEPIEPEEIPGLGYKAGGRIILAPPRTCFEMLDFADLPYHLVEISADRYNRMNNGEVIFPVFTALGCPYKCSYCMSPAVLGKIKGKKWLAIPTEKVLDHVADLLGRYRFQRLQILDDDSFVDLRRMRQFLEAYIARGFPARCKLDFRGARVNELDRMDEAYLRLMVEANVEILLIGVESGSDRVLRDLMSKGITREQIVRVNRKLARFPSLKPHYNMFCGVPGETIEDLYQTADLILELVRDHPGCYIGIGGDWKPLPGSAMTDRAVEQFGLALPQDLEGWAAIDSFDREEHPNYPWYTAKTAAMIRLLQVAGALLDAKGRDFHSSFGPVLGKLLYAATLVYRPVLRTRMRRRITACLFESRLLDLLLKNLARLVPGKAPASSNSAVPT